MDIRHHLHEADRVESLVSYDILDSPARDAFESVVLSASALCGTPMASINLVAGDRQWSLAGRGVDDLPTGREFSICSDVVASETAVVVGDLSADPRYAELSAEWGVRAYAGVPLLGGDGLPLGALCVLDDHARAFSDGEVARLQSLAAQVVALLDVHRSTPRSAAPDATGQAPSIRRLRQALDDAELVPHYQPVVDLATGAVLGFEALLRWEHPRLGLLPPADFLPAIEASGLIRPVGRHVLATAIAVLANLRRSPTAAVPGRAGLTMAVNVSGEQLRRPGLADFALATLAEHGLPGSALIVEVVESTRIADFEVAAHEMGRLRAAGVGISLDDYGSGWSGLQRLLQLPFTAIKLDHTLTRSLGDDPRIGALVSSTVALAADLGLDLIVEGVETRGQQRVLLDSGCTRAQGWLFGRAVPADRLPAVLAAAAVASTAAREPVAAAGTPRRARAGSSTGPAGRWSGAGPRPLPPVPTSSAHVDAISIGSIHPERKGAAPTDDRADHAPAQRIPAAALLDALPDATAVVDRDGVIVAVNFAWRMFTLDNAGDPATTGVGVNYLEVCRRSAATGCSDANEVSAGLRAVLDGRTVESEFQYPCPSPAVGRWFVLRITPLDGPLPGAVIAHSNISSRKRAEEDLQRRASQDPLTQLANRERFTATLTAALTPRPERVPKADVGLVYLDLDGFKPVNDTYGHAAGDEVLQAVAGRLRQVTRPQDCVARLGGDEFAVIAPRITAAGLTDLAGRIERSLTAPHRVHGVPVEVGASVGTYLAAAGEGPTDCVHRADEAMYATKLDRAGR